MTVINDAQYSEVKSLFDAKDLVDHLKDFRRESVIVVVTPTLGGQFVFDADQIMDEVADYAVRVFVLSDADLTYTLTDAFGQSYSVFGGAARVYPKGVRWMEDMFLAPLFMARDVETAQRRQPALIDKAIEFSFITPRDQLPSRETQRLNNLPVVSLGKSMPKPVTNITVEAPVRAPAGESAPAVEGLEPTPQSDLVSERDETISARDQTIVERDKTINDLSNDIHSERERVSTVTEMLIAAQEQHQAYQRRWGNNEIKARELLVENAELKNKIAGITENHRTQLKSARSRNVTTESTTDPYRPSLFPSAEAAIRYAICTGWVDRVPASEKNGHPLPEYRIGEQFVESFEQFDRAIQYKALKAIVDVLTGLDRKRKVHPMRLNSASPIVTRDDGATCFRAYIEEKVASARRLHFWKLEDGSIELSRIVVHDDYEA